MVYKTPGVFVEEISTLPPSVVAVETAVPAFLGYSEKAEDGEGNDLSLKPTRIKSLLEYEERFGGDFVPASYQVVVDTDNENAVGKVTAQDASDNPRRYYLYASIRHFYANGGGACYIVSAGDYDDAPSLSALQSALTAVEKLDAPTLLVFPDGVSLDAGELGSLQNAALAQCAKLQDRFMITDLRQGNLPTSLSVQPIADFRNNVGTVNLKYGAAYYPWVRTIYRLPVALRELNLVDPALAPIPDTSIVTGDSTLDALLPTARAADDHVQTVVTAVSSAGLVGEALTRSNFRALGARHATLVAALRASTTVPTARTAFTNIVRLPRAIALALEALRLDATLPAEVAQAVTILSSDGDVVATVRQLIALEKNEDVRLTIAPSGHDESDVDAEYASLNSSPWILSSTAVSDIAADAQDFGDTPSVVAVLRATGLSAAVAFEPLTAKLVASVTSVFDAADFLANEAQKSLFDAHPVLAAVKEQVQRFMSTLPASGGVTGVYASVDRTRGVWKAPANLSLADVVGPVVKINDELQAGLNVDVSGKSVNALRAFAGKGTLVWGARTLAGNDNEWRYVPVRRFFNMAEESIKKATEPFTFEPNDANTWVRVRAMIDNFLTVQWRQGALAGAVPAQAFYVKVGLGETMTAQDILEGRMIVEVGMAVVRPAEFIVLKFAHKMQVS